MQGAGEKSRVWCSCPHWTLSFAGHYRGSHEHDGCVEGVVCAGGQAFPGGRTAGRRVSVSRLSAVSGTSAGPAFSLYLVVWSGLVLEFGRVSVFSRVFPHLRLWWVARQPHGPNTLIQVWAYELFFVLSLDCGGCPPVWTVPVWSMMD